jgi:hypothetical protein
MVLIATAIDPEHWDETAGKWKACRRSCYILARAETEELADLNASLCKATNSCAVIGGFAGHLGNDLASPAGPGAGRIASPPRV